MMTVWVGVVGTGKKNNQFRPNVPSSVGWAVILPWPRLPNGTVSVSNVPININDADSDKVTQMTPLFSDLTSYQNVLESQIQLGMPQIQAQEIASKLGLTLT